MRGNFGFRFPTITQRNALVNGIDVGRNWSLQTTAVGCSLQSAAISEHGVRCTMGTLFFAQVAHAERGPALPNAWERRPSRKLRMQSVDLHYQTRGNDVHRASCASQSVNLRNQTHRVLVFLRKLRMQSVYLHYQTRLIFLCMHMALAW